MMAAVRLLRWWLASSECFMVIARGLQAAAFAVGIERGVAAMKEDRFYRQGSLATVFRVKRNSSFGQSVCYFTVPPRAHPSAGSPSGSLARSSSSTEW